jgi:hypothetical protein
VGPASGPARRALGGADVVQGEGQKDVVRFCTDVDGGVGEEGGVARVVGWDRDGGRDGDIFSHRDSDWNGDSHRESGWDNGLSGWDRNRDRSHLDDRRQSIGSRSLRDQRLQSTGTAVRREVGAGPGGGRGSRQRRVADTVAAADDRTVTLLSGMTDG